MSSSYQANVLFGKKFSKKNTFKTVLQNGCSHDFNREKNNFCGVCGKPSTESTQMFLFDNIEDISEGKFIMIEPYDTAEFFVVGIDYVSINSYSNNLIKTGNFEKPSPEVIQNLLDFFDSLGLKVFSDELSFHLVMSVG